MLDEYSSYMRGELHLGWSPICGKWCLVHIEPVRITNDLGMFEGKLSRLAFYMGGKEIFSYTAEDLSKFGLERKVSTFGNKSRGQFIIHEIEQIPGTNDYVLPIEKIGDDLTVPEKLLFDITTGKIFTNPMPFK